MDTNDGNECLSVGNESNEHSNENKNETTTDNETHSPISGPATIPDRDESSVAPTSGPVTIPDCADLAGSPISGPVTIPDRVDVEGTPISGPATIPDRDLPTESPTAGPATIPDCDDQIRVPKIDLDADETIPKQVEGNETHAQANATSSAKQQSKSNIDEQLQQVQSFTMTQFEDDSLTVRMSTIDINGKTRKMTETFEGVPIEAVMERLPAHTKKLMNCKPGSEPYVPKKSSMKWKPSNISTTLSHSADTQTHGAARKGAKAGSPKFPMTPLTAALLSGGAPPNPNQITASSTASTKTTTTRENQAPQPKQQQQTPSNAKGEKAPKHKAPATGSSLKVQHSPAVKTPAYPQINISKGIVPHRISTIQKWVSKHYKPLNKRSDEDGILTVEEQIPLKISNPNDIQAVLGSLDLAGMRKAMDVQKFTDKRKTRIEIALETELETWNSDEPSPDQIAVSGRSPSYTDLATQEKSAPMITGLPGNQHL